MAAISKQYLPERIRRRFPRFLLPVARLARLAMATRHQKQGLSELLLADAPCRCLRLFCDELSMIGIIVDPKDVWERRWRQRYKFERLRDMLRPCGCRWRL